jgi:hypothetical protein
MKTSGITDMVHNESAYSADISGKVDYANISRFMFQGIFENQRS